MKKEKVKQCGSSDNERKKEVEGKEPCEGCIIYREASPDSLNQGVAHVGDGGEEIGNDSGPPERYLSSWQNVADKSSHHYKEQ